MTEEQKEYKTNNIKNTLNMIRDGIHQNAIEHGWHDVKREFGTVMMLCVGELSEAMEEHRNHEKPDDLYLKDGKPEGIPVEIADCIIRLLDYCGQEKIDIGEAIMQKHNYNLTRSYRHGNKAC